MKKITCFLFLFLFIGNSIFAQEKSIKNVIVMIPDGTSLSALSAARWFQRYNHPEITKLNIDPYLCGTILTYSSNAPIGDSAPTTSCYMTGYPSRAGWVSTYPTADSNPNNDILPVDTSKAYQPLMTVMEAARITRNKALGLVVTCEFPHATPADCMAHSYSRSKYEWLAPQMVHNGIDVVIGGGVSILKPEMKAFLEKEGYGVFLNDITHFQNYKGNKMWALFKDTDMSYDIDRNPAEEPSLAEMTQKAIEKLSQDEDGFVLMVEGSKIDWAAHANDAAAIISDMLSFDKACGVAFDFAEKNGETLVIVVPDHGNSGFSIGSNKCPQYSTLTKDELFGPISKFKTSADGLVRRLQQTEASKLKEVVLELTGIELSDREYQQLLECADYNRSSLTNEERMKGSKLTKTAAQILDSHTCFGFTTGGHTGEEVFLAVLDPTSNRMTGHHTNIELNQYLRQSLGLQQSLESLTDEYFAKHTRVFNGYTYTITTQENVPVLEVKNKKNKLVIRPNTNIVLINGQEHALNSVVVYVDKNNTFYLPQSLRKLL
ncbi:MAG: Alkaline phosphatase [Candidatus Ordinivivax streblomastigis]|uniref:Alkaline phosphatase n=1 Tax=Candidatus Ordinivivax streblomastigis TaxID=2540710 RepID=A0A5M8P186_9BACT|nr:MAG: Alkaline phosphatase [Candidatus Ordinivivax streblomastigis]